MSKHLYKINYNNCKFIGENKKKTNIKKILSKTLKNNNNNINNNNDRNSNITKNHKSNSCREISQSDLPENIKEQCSNLSEDKLTIKTTLLKPIKIDKNNIKKDDQKKYHINFELLTNANINNNININMTFI